MRTLTIVIPAYNEERFIGPLLEKVLRVPTEQIGFSKEIIVVDDGSRDRTFDVASGYKGVTCVKQEPNQGKGRAVQRGIRECSGDYVLVQDADLEYNPEDYLTMLRALNNEEGDCIYGSRTLGQIRKRESFSLFPGRHADQGMGSWMAGVLLSVWTFLLFGVWITDTLTAYKLYPTKTLKGLCVKTHGFETDHEITAKLIKARVKIREVPIDYSPRSARWPESRVDFDEVSIFHLRRARSRLQTIQLMAALENTRVKTLIVELT
jgi:dolichol-phosphate mannosyltransferase